MELELIKDAARKYAETVGQDYATRSKDDFHGLITENAANDAFLKGIEWYQQNGVSNSNGVLRTEHLIALPTEDDQEFVLIDIRELLNQIS